MTRLLGTFKLESYAGRSFLRGAASAMDLRGNTRQHYIFSQTPGDADTQAIRDDWRALGEDLRRAVNTSGR